jgi:hypothetical protein
MLKQICKEPSCIFFGRYCRIEGHVEIQSKKPGIAKVAAERQQVNKEYEKVKREFLAKKKFCEVCMTEPATAVHHKRGRVGKYLTDVRYFLATCFPCHRLIEEDPLFAKREGYSESRLKKENAD